MCEKQITNQFFGRKDALFRLLPFLGSSHLKDLLLDYWLFITPEQMNILYPSGAAFSNNEKPLSTVSKVPNQTVCCELCRFCQISGVGIKTALGYVHCVSCFLSQGQKVCSNAFIHSNGHETRKSKTNNIWVGGGGVPPGDNKCAVGIQQRDGWWPKTTKWCPLPLIYSRLPMSRTHIYHRV